MIAASISQDGSSKKKILISSLLFMGLGHVLYLKQYVKGILYALIEVLFLLFTPTVYKKIVGLITLGDPHPELPIKQRDHSMFMMIDGILILAVVFIFILLYYLSVQNALSDYKDYCATGIKAKNKNIFAELGNKSFPIVGLMPMILLVLFFVVVPLIFSACVAFTNYSAPKNIPPNNTVDWVGLDNFRALFGGDATWSGALGRVATWTLVWAFFATLTCYAGGMIMAVILQESKIKIKPFFRSIFILPYAVPTVVSMLVWQNLLNGSFGTVNRSLIALGFLDKSTVIPWLSDVTLARFVVILINLWAGFPYFMLLTMGT
ncbi:MAG TPA: sugar ABC transporter permease, partial [Flexilinea sp.]|nr:sugar ABC transporter permease [Flexilinea sp.]